MDQSTIVSIYSFLVVFGFLTAIVLGLRALFGRGGKSGSNRLQSFGAEGMESGTRLWPEKTPQDHLAPPAAPRDDFDYHHAADYVLDRISPYSIPRPPQRDEGEW